MVKIVWRFNCLQARDMQITCYPILSDAEFSWSPYLTKILESRLPGAHPTNERSITSNLRIFSTLNPPQYLPYFEYDSAFRTHHHLMIHEEQQRNTTCAARSVQRTSSEHRLCHERDSTSAVFVAFDARKRSEESRI